ncbi:MAG: S9 family peptidase [Pseudomonadota bacterium]
MKKQGILLVMLVALAAGLYADRLAGQEAEKKPLDAKSFLKIHWIKGPQLSPDGKLMVLASTYKDLGTNKSRTNLYVDKVYESGPAKRFTFTDKSDFHPAFSPDGETIAFLSTRSGAPQIWTIPTAGGEAKQLSSFPTGIDSFAWSPDGKRFAFVSRVWVECNNDVKCLAGKVKKQDEGGGRVMEKIPFRVWDAWVDGTRSHLFVMPSDGKGEAVDLTPFDHDVPPVDLGSSHDFVWSPDGKRIAFVMNETDSVAWNTDNDVFMVSSKGGKLEKISKGDGGDAAPLFSPDGKYLATTSMERPGFEADRRRLALYNLETGKNEIIAPDLDLTIHDFVWSPDSKGVYFYAPEKGRRAIYFMDLKGKRRKVYADGHNGQLAVTPDGKSLVFLHETSSMTPNIFRIDNPAKNPSEPVQLTFFNKQLMDGRLLGTLDEFWFEGAKGEKVHAFLMKPPGFDAQKKYPAIFMLHGGPQGDWDDSFHPRWNTQMFASRGFVLVAINFHGSTGYGQAFTDSISKHWGDYPLEDIMKGVDYACANYSFIDPDRLGAAGASYGGYLANWLLGHTDRFKAVFTHAGVWDLHSDYGSTEELWFPEWEFGGTPWDNPELYDKFSPSSFIKSIAKHKTPTLVSHGAGDFRVALEQGIQLFNVLQRLGIESKFLYFPDETHFVQKARNVKLFYETFLDWFEDHL